MDGEHSSWMVPVCVLIWEEGHKSLLGFPSCKGILFMKVTPRIQSPPKALSLAARTLCAAAEAAWDSWPHPRKEFQDKSVGLTVGVY